MATSKTRVKRKINQEIVPLILELTSPERRYHYHITLSFKVERLSVTLKLLPTSPGACERKHGERNWDGDIDSNLTDVDVMREFTRRGSIGGEDGSTVAITIAAIKGEWDV
jgi:hypothetical protein